MNVSHIRFRHVLKGWLGCLRIRSRIVSGINGAPKDNTAGKGVLSFIEDSGRLYLSGKDAIPHRIHD